jgi:protein-tyrosine phosphatase
MLPELYTFDKLRMGRLSIMAHPRGGDWLEDEIRGLRQAGINVMVSLLTRPEVIDLNLSEEANLARANGIEYRSWPINDRGVPILDRNTFAFFSELSDFLAQGKHVVIHCRVGIGRSSLVAASLLVMAGRAVEQAFEALAQARGRPVPDTEEQREWVVRFAESRKFF